MSLEQHESGIHAVSDSGVARRRTRLGGLGLLGERLASISAGYDLGPDLVTA